MFQEWLFNLWVSQRDREDSEEADAIIQVQEKRSPDKGVPVI